MTQRQGAGRTRRPAAERRSQILEAAFDVLRSDGPDHFTTSRVAAAAGVSKGTLFHVFGTRAELVDAMRQRWWSLLADGPRRRAEAADTARDAVGAAVTAIVEDSAAAEQLHHALGRLGHSAVEPLHLFEELFRELFERGRASGEFDVHDAASAARFCTAGLHRQLVTGADAADPAAITEMILRAVGSD